MKKLIGVLTVIGVLLFGGSALAANQTIELYEVININEHGVQGVNLNNSDEGVWIELEDVKDFYLEIGATIQVEFETVEGEEVIKDIKVVEIDDFKITSVNYDKDNNTYHYGGKSLTNDSGVYFTNEDIDIKANLNDIVRASFNEDDELLYIEILKQ